MGAVPESPAGLFLDVPNAMPLGTRTPPNSTHKTNLQRLHTPCPDPSCSDDRPVNGVPLLASFSAASILFPSGFFFPPLRFPSHSGSPPDDAGRKQKQTRKPPPPAAPLHLPRVLPTSQAVLSGRRQRSGSSREGCPSTTSTLLDAGHRGRSRSRLATACQLFFPTAPAKKRRQRPK